MQHICLHEGIALQNALRYNFSLLIPARFFNYLRVKIPFPSLLVLRKFSDKNKIFRQAKIGETTAPALCHCEMHPGPVTTPLIIRIVFMVLYSCENSPTPSSHRYTDQVYIL